jgi:SAM-dependent methyltransferase
MYCPVCSSKKIIYSDFPLPTLFNEKIFNYLKCTDCLLVFIYPFLSESDYQFLYSEKYHSEFYFKDGYKPRKWLSNYVENLTEKKRILDFGCGDGSFLNYCQLKGHSCVGIDYDRILIEKLKIKYPNIEFRSVDDLGSKDLFSFDMIHLGDVLEHLVNPVEFLKSLKIYMKKDKSYILAQGPLENNSNLSFALRKSITFLIKRCKTNLFQHKPYHLTFTNYNNQNLIFRNSGLHTIKYTVLEESWPYPNQFKGSFINRVKFLVSKLSIIVSLLIFWKKYGNRYEYIGSFYFEK